MSIEVVGPEKYELQDLVCLELALRLEDHEQLAIYIEPKGREDALILFSRAGKRYELEVQVKGSSVAVGLDAIASCLTHFPPNSGSGCLLERLLESNQRFVLLAFSGRCTDAASKLVADRSSITTPRVVDFMLLREAKALLKAIGEQWKDASTPLEQARRQTSVGLSKKLEVREFRDALRRLLLEEQLSDHSVRSQCEGILRSRHLVPTDTLSDAVSALGAEIRKVKYESRNSRVDLDASPRLNSVLARFSPPSLRPTDYAERGDELAWKSALSRTGALLLSGRPRCGKSFAGLRVAAEFQALGYKVKQGSEVDEASRYLLDNAFGDRLFLLDDPLGSLQAELAAHRSLDKLKWLISRLPSNRKLVVAQSQDELFEVLRTSSLAECAIGPMQWLDLAATRPEFLARVWDLMVMDHSVRSDVESAITPLLRNGVLDLELGCLRHLAAAASELPPNPNIDQIVQLARQDSRTMGLFLAHSDPNMSNLLVALAIGTAPGKPIQLQELAFLLQQGQQTRAGELPFGMAYTLGGKQEEEEFPRYPSEQQLSDAIERQVDALERRRFISVVNDSIQFEHPFYRSAAQGILEHPSTLFAKLVLDTFDRALFCLSPVTACAAVKNAQWLYRALANRTVERDVLLHTLEDGLRSRFPIVRDLCFEYLLQHLIHIGRGESSDLGHWVHSAVSISLEDLKWHEGQAWIPSIHTGSAFFLRHKHSFDLAELQDDITHLESGLTVLVPPARAAQVLTFYSDDPKELSLPVASALLGYEEAAIRARVARVWISVDRHGDSDLLEQLFQDRHPSISLELYEASLEAWPELAPARRELVIQGLAKASMREEVAAALLPNLIAFDRVEYSGENPPWAFFESVMPNVLNNLPHGVRFTQARLYSVMQSASRHCSSESVVVICESWLNWLLREAKNRSLDEYELSIIDIVVPATRQSPQLRQGMAARLLSISGTSTLIYILRDLIQHWSDLTRAERELVRQLLAADRTDRLWLHAVVLTRFLTPAELQEQILGDRTALDRSAEHLTRDLAPKLLSATISVQCGRPGYFWNIAHSSTLFDEVVRIVERCPSHPDFETAFQEAISKMDDARIPPIVESAKKDELEKVFSLMLRERVEWTGNLLPRSWAALLSRADEGQKENWIKRMADAAPACVDDLTQALKWLIREEDQRAFFIALAGDAEAELLLIHFRKANQTAREDILGRLTALLESDPPRFYGTYNTIKEVLTEHRVHNEALFGKIAQLRERCCSERELIKDRFREVDQIPDGWIE